MEGVVIPFLCLLNCHASSSVLDNCERGSIHPLLLCNIVVYIVFVEQIEVVPFCNLRVGVAVKLELDLLTTSQGRLLDDSNDRWLLLWGNFYLGWFLVARRSNLIFGLRFLALDFVNII